MDRNSAAFIILRMTRFVALRKESVDRNVLVLEVSPGQVLSLSARRAWIEMLLSSAVSSPSSVALRKESVDRNAVQASSYQAQAMSLSARRAWIEILAAAQLAVLLVVALRKESVDRNWPDGVMHWILIGRSPQGERG